MNFVRRLRLRTLVIAVLLSGPSLYADDLDTRVANVLKTTPLIDGHNDMPCNITAESVIIYHNLIWLQT